MRLLILNYEDPPLGGGAGNALAHLLAEWGRMPEFTADIVVSSPDIAVTETLRDGVQLHRLDIGKRGGLHYQTQKDLLRYAWRAYRKCKQLQTANRYDGCLAFFGIPCGVVATGLRLPFIVSLRGSDVPFYNPRFALLDQLVFQHLSRGVWGSAAAVVANSEGLKSLALQTAPRQSIAVIPNGVDTAAFHPASDPPEGLHILSVARLIPRKGLHHLIAAVAQLPDARLTIVGGGTEGPALEALVCSLGVEERVTFAGAVPHEDLPARYRSASVFVLPSLNEGMSNTVLEAVASGLPVLLTDTGGTRELLSDGENGFLIDAEPSAIAAALSRYRENPALLRSHGKASRARAEHFSWAAAAEAYMQLFHDCFGIAR